MAKNYLHVTFSDVEGQDNLINTPNVKRQRKTTKNSFEGKQRTQKRKAERNHKKLIQSL